MHATGMLKRWHLAQADATGGDVSGGELAGELGVEPFLGSLLTARGLGGVDACRDFLCPQLRDLHDPALLPGAAAAAARIDKAIAERQPIVIYGDYDVDGITATAILWHVLTMAGGEAGSQVSRYVPHRLDEGYGLNDQAIRKLCQPEDGRVPLIITVDCGITANGTAQLAKELGADLIITDHHNYDPANLPPACCLVHPRLEPDAHGLDAAYPFGDLCGAGVAFKLAWQFARLHCGSERVPAAFRDLLMDLLSLVALGTVADVVPLTGENRVMTFYGLGQIKRTRFVGLQAMIDAAKLNEEKIDSYHIGFILGPRLNACGRMGHARHALRLLTDVDSNEAAKLATFLTRENEQRRATGLAIFNEAKHMVVELGYDAPEHRAIVLGKEGWHQGVVGIVAGRLAEMFGRPTVVLGYEDRQARGSARSVDGVCLHEALTACREHLEQFGGHSMAAGLTMDRTNVDLFREEFVKFINGKLSPEQLVGVLHIDAQIQLEQCTAELFEQIQQLSPFGRGNEPVLLMLSDIKLEAAAQRMGGGGRHLSMLLRSASTQQDRVIRAVGFGMGNLADHLPAGAAIDIVFSPKVSIWRGQKRMEYYVKDLRLNTKG